MEAKITIVSREEDYKLDIIITPEQITLRHNDESEVPIPHDLFCEFVHTLEATHNALHATVFNSVVLKDPTDDAELFALFFQQYYDHEQPGGTGATDARRN